MSEKSINYDDLLNPPDYELRATKFSDEIKDKLRSEYPTVSFQLSDSNNSLNVAGFLLRQLEESLNDEQNEVKLRTSLKSIRNIRLVFDSENTAASFGVDVMLSSTSKSDLQAAMTRVKELAASYGAETIADASHYNNADEIRAQQLGPHTDDIMYLATCSFEFK